MVYSVSWSDCRLLRQFVRLRPTLTLTLTLYPSRPSTNATSSREASLMHQARSGHTPAGNTITLLAQQPPTSLAQPPGGRWKGLVHTCHQHTVPAPKAQPQQEEGTKTAAAVKTLLPLPPGWTAEATAEPTSLLTGLVGRNGWALAGVSLAFSGGHTQPSRLFKCQKDAVNGSLCVSRPVMSDSATPRTIACKLVCPRNPPGENTGVGCHSLLQRSFPTQGLNLDLLHHSQILYHLSYREVLF